ncbi:MAG: hypothetical protein Q7T36_13750 [Fluviicoccus sp.]|uniref:hypothetical protein n=1 Tax=Fluviicoccus sp. TaxID=2003552 RepID=UPI002719A0DF|nr:hypothetical protein [Fluviicoccus sp.]MDO8331524.1 hypothetical protein [Fluviicoccus sp.]
MMKTTRLTAAMLSVSLILTGCFEDSESETGKVDVVVGFDPVPLPGNNTVIPFPFDGLFAGNTMPTLNIPNPSGNPLVTQANLLDGFSTTASSFIDIFGFVDLATVEPNLVIVNRATGEILVPGVDFKVQAATVPDKTGIALNRQRTRILIEPLKPLAPSTTYLVGLKRGVKTLTGGNVMPSQMYPILSSSTPIASQKDPVLARYSATQKATLEALRAKLISPAVAYLTTFGKVKAADLALAYSFTTQSINKTLDRLAASAEAQPIAAAPLGKTVKDLLPAIGEDGSFADVYAGFTVVPSYQKTSGGNIHSAEPLTSYWAADAAGIDGDAMHLGATKCSNFAASPSASTTNCFPMPVKRTDQKIPMLVTVPNAASGYTRPAGGWPVVIFQHGITRSRADLLALAPALAKAGFVAVAIDLPLHGQLPTEGLYKNAFFTGSPAAGLMADERTFDLDTGRNAVPDPDPVMAVPADYETVLTNNEGAVVGDSKTDTSGAHFIKIGSPITSRDNLRQGVSDLLTLRKSLANLDLNQDGTPDINMSQVRFASISLGGIVGGVFLGVDRGALKVTDAAAMSVTGGGIGKLLDASSWYGPQIAFGLKSKGVVEGTDDFETFLRLAQTVVDSADPVNYAALARANHPVLLTELLNDDTVPNKAVAGPTVVGQDKVSQTGFLSGTEPMAKLMGLDLVSPPVNGSTTARAPVLGANLGLWVQFNSGRHGSLLDPSPVSATATGVEKLEAYNVTVEMQKQMVSFLKSNGMCLPIGAGSSCTAP